MSRVGKKLVVIPAGVKVAVAGQTVTVEGPKGKLSMAIPDDIGFSIDGDKVQISRKNDLKPVRQKHGMSRAIFSNLVTGVFKGFERKLEVSGIGYKVEKKDESTLVFTIGYSHPVTFKLPEGIKAVVDPKNTKIAITGADRQQLGQCAANIRSIKHADPYKLKGIKYAEEKIKQKVGKTGAA